MDAEMEKTPNEVKPILRAIQAHWFHSYYQQNQWRFARRSATAEAPGEDIETWDLKRILAEVDKRFQAALADKAALQKLPVTTFGEIFTKGEPGDTFRPTVYQKRIPGKRTGNRGAHGIRPATSAASASPSPRPCPTASTTFRRWCARRWKRLPGNAPRPSPRDSSRTGGKADRTSPPGPP